MTAARSLGVEQDDGWARRLPHEQLRHRVASVVREQILNGELRPNEFLRLGSIADELGVSITPVREALLLLAQDGWLSQELNRGFRVREVRRRDVEDVYLMWGLAEGEIAARAAPLVTDAHLAALRAVDERLQAYDPVHDGQRGLALNRAFHRKLHEIADAPKLSWFSEGARRLVPFEFWFDFDQVPGWHAFNQHGHTALVAHLEGRDEDGARQDMRGHFEATGELLLAWLDSLAFWSEGGSLATGHGGPQRALGLTDPGYDPP